LTAIKPTISITLPHQQGKSSRFPLAAQARQEGPHRPAPTVRRLEKRKQVGAHFGAHALQVFVLNAKASYTRALREKASATLERCSLIGMLSLSA
jgi:hypothetical protein